MASICYANMYQQIYYSIELTRKLELLSKNYFLKERESEEHLPSCFALTDFGEEEEIVFFIFCTIQNPYFTLVRTTNNMLYEEVQNIVPSCDYWGFVKIEPSLCRRRSNVFFLHLL